MPQLYDTPVSEPTGGPPTGVPPAFRKKKRRVEDGPDIAPLPEATTTDWYGKLAAAEGFNQGYLPTSLTYSVALGATHNRDAARAAAALVRNSEVPRLDRSAILDKRDVPVLIDPLTGQPISAKRAQQMHRYSRAQMALQASAVIMELASKGLRVPLEGVRGPRQHLWNTRVVRFRPAMLQRAFEALSVLPGKADARDMFAYATTLISSDTDLNAFSLNLAQVRDWVGHSAVMNDASMVGMAMYWTQRHPDRAITNDDIVRLTNPDFYRLTRPLRPDKPMPDMSLTEWNKTYGWRLSETTFSDVLAIQEKLQRGARAMPEAYRIASVLVQEMNAEPHWTERFATNTFNWMDGAWEKLLAGVWIPLGATVHTLETGDAATGMAQAWDEAQAAWMHEPGVRVENYAAQALGFEPGTTAYDLTSMGISLVVGWMLDPGVLMGLGRRLAASSRLATVSEYELRGLGVLKPLARRLITARNLEEVISTYGDTAMGDINWGPWSQYTSHFGKGTLSVGAPGMARRYASALGVSEERALAMPFKEFLVRLIAHDPESATRAFRGYAGLGPGINDKVAWYIYDRFHSVWGGTEKALSDPRFLSESWDTFKTALGIKSPTEAAASFDEFIRSEAPDITRSSIDGGIRSLVKRRGKNIDALFRKDGSGLKTSAERSMRNRLSNSLQRSGVSPSRTGKIVNEVMGWSLDDWHNAVAEVDEAVTPLVNSITSGEIRTAARTTGAATWRDGLYQIEGAQRVIPTIGPLQIVRDMQTTFWDSPFWRAKMVERMGVEHMAKMFTEQAYRPWMNIEEYASAEVFAQTLRHLGFDDEYVQGAMSHYTTYQLLPYGQKENLFYEQMQNIYKDFYHRYGIPEFVAQKLVDYALPRIRYGGYISHEFYGMARRRLDTGEIATVPLEDPPLGTMLLNTLMLPDPRQLDRAVRHAFGSVDEIQAMSRRLFDMDVEDLSTEQMTTLVSSASKGKVLDGIFGKWDYWERHAPNWYGKDFLHRAWTLGGQEFDTMVRFFDALRSYWVAWTLFRVGWPMKVLPDENMRAIIVLHSLLDRAAAIPFIGRALERVPGANLGERSATVLRELPKERVPVSRAARPEDVANSYVRDILYHGDGRTFQELAYNPELGNGPWGSGFMFTDNVDLANKAALRATEGGNITRAYVNMTNPFVREAPVDVEAIRALRQRFRESLVARADEDGQVWSVMHGQGMFQPINDVAEMAYDLVEQATRRGMTNGEFYDRLVRLFGGDRDAVNTVLRGYGYDGIVGQLGRTEEMGYLAFHPGQVFPETTRPGFILRERTPEQVKVDFGVPWRASREPATAQGIAGRKMFRSVGQQMSRRASIARNESLQVITPSMGRSYWESLDWTLNERVYQSPVGREVLRYLAGDLGAEGRPILTKAGLMDEVRRYPEFRALSRGIGEERALENAIGYIDHAINGSKELAAHMLNNRGATIDAIRSLIQARRADLPEIYVRDLEEASMFGRGRTERMMDGFFRVFMRAPSDYLNRNPLYQELYKRELDRITTAATQSGRKFTDAEIVQLRTGEHPMNLTAKTYALDKELKTMYTFMQRSRFAEATRFIFPFFSPFEEQWRVWGRLLWENPSIIPRAHMLWKAAQQVGAVRKDENGQWVVPAPWLATAILASTFFHPIGWIPAGVALGAPKLASLAGVPNTDWVYPLTSLNLFFASPFRAHVGGAEVIIPLPGFGPGAETIFQAAVEAWPKSWPGKSALMSYAFAYGPGPRFVPFGMGAFLRSLFPSDRTTTRLANDLLDVAVLNGARVSGMSDEELQKLRKQVMDQAADWNRVLNLIGWASPTPPELNLESDTIRNEYFDMLDEGMTAEQATRIIKDKYGQDRPDIGLVLSAHTMMMRGLTGGGIAPPSNELFAKILENPEYATAFRRHPEFGYFLVPQEFRDKNLAFDYNLWSKELADGVIDYREPFIFTEGELTGGRAYEYMVQEGWNQYFATLEHFNAKVDAYEAKHQVTLDDSDHAYQAMYKEIVEPQIQDISEQFPSWAKEYDRTRTQDHFTARNLQQLRAISTKPTWSQTGFGKAMAAYFAFRDPIYDWMVKHNVGDITDSTYAKEMGKTKEFNQGIKDLTEQYGSDFTIPYRMWMDHDLHFIRETQRDKAIEGMTKKDIAFNAHWEDKFESLQDEAYGGYISPNDQRAAYARLRTMSLRAAEYSEKATGNPFDPSSNPQMLWWNDMSDGEQAEYALRKATTPYVFLSPFDRNVVLGVKTDPANEYLWSRIEERKLQTYRQNEADPEHTRQHWDEFNRWVDGLVAQNPGFAPELKRNTTWGWAVWKVISTQHKDWMQGIEGKCWKAFQSYTRQVRGLFQEDGYIDDVERVKVNNIYDDLIEQLSEFSPDWKAHYHYLQNIAGTDLHDIFIPQYWYLKV